MHHHHALALLVFSIVFAAFALFTLCTFAPKAHASSVINNSPGEAQISALSGLPIRRRFNNESSLYVGDGILLNYRGHGTMTANVETGNSLTYPFSPLMAVNSIKQNNSKLYQECAQHLRIFDSSLPLEMNLAEDGILSKMFTAATLLKRDYQSLPNACVKYFRSVVPPAAMMTSVADNVESNENVGVYFEKMPVKRQLNPELEKKKKVDNKEQQRTDLKENTILTEEVSPKLTKQKHTGVDGNVILTEEKSGSVPAMKRVSTEKVVTVNQQLTGERYHPVGSKVPVKNYNFHLDKSILEKRDDPNLDLLGAPTEVHKKKVFIDFKKAQRDAQLADLADGFLIETEYLTPGRKVVQHLGPKPGTRTVKLHFEGEKLILDDSANANILPLPTDAQGIIDGVLAKHDQQQMDSFINYYPQPGSLMSASQVDSSPLSTYQQPTHRRYDLAKRSSERIEPPLRRSFRFDRRV